MRALHGGFPTEGDLANAGLTPEECTSPNEDGFFYDPEAKAWRQELWADNWPAIKFYSEWSSQWRVAAGMDRLVYIGLDYNVLLHELDRKRLASDDYDDLLGCLRVIEAEAAKLLNK